MLINIDLFRCFECNKEEYINKQVLSLYQKYDKHVLDSLLRFLPPNINPSKKLVSYSIGGQFFCKIHRISVGGV